MQQYVFDYYYKWKSYLGAYPNSLRALSMLNSVSFSPSVAVYGTPGNTAATSSVLGVFMHVFCKHHQCKPTRSMKVLGVYPICDDVDVMASLLELKGQADGLRTANGR